VEFPSDGAEEEESPGRSSGGVDALTWRARERRRSGMRRRRRRRRMRRRHLEGGGRGCGGMALVSEQRAKPAQVRYAVVLRRLCAHQPQGDPAGYCHTPFCFACWI